jgi:hypothetical protein
MNFFLSWKQSSNTNHSHAFTKTIERIPPSTARKRPSNMHGYECVRGTNRMKTAKEYQSAWRRRQLLARQRPVVDEPRHGQALAQVHVEVAVCMIHAPGLSVTKRMATHSAVGTLRRSSAARGRRGCTWWYHCSRRSSRTRSRRRRSRARAGAAGGSRRLGCWCPAAPPPRSCRT